MLVNNSELGFFLFYINSAFKNSLKLPFSDFIENAFMVR